MRGKPVGIENNRALAIFLLQAVGVKFCLLLTHQRVLAGALGFHHGQRPAIVAPKDIINKALTCSKGHAADFDFFEAIAAEGPACVFQVDVDVLLAG